MTPYDAVNATWPAVVPPITRTEAERAARKLYLKFYPPSSVAAYRGIKKVHIRRIWIALNPETSGDLRRGWKRLVHDISHRAHSRWLPHFNDHGKAHATLEAEMIRYVLDNGWLDGKLKPPAKVPPGKTPPDVLARVKLAHVEAAIKRWETKRKRAETALKKLRAKARRLDKVTTVA